jgi:hypothetical protein
MAAVVRNRVSKQLIWPAEGEELRSRRRTALCELDGLLTHLEEINLRGLVVPGWVRNALQRHGIDIRPHHAAPDMIEAIFLAQERYMLRPETDGRAPQLRRRIA